MADTGGDIGHEAAHSAANDGEVEDSLLLAVIDAGELGLVGFLLDDLDLLDELGRDVLGGNLRVVHEEGLAFHIHLGDGLAVYNDGAVVIDLDAGELLQKVLEDVVLSGLEGACIVFDGIFLDRNGGAHVGDAGGLEHFTVELELHFADGDVLALDDDFLFKLDIAHHLGREGIGTIPEAGKRSRSLLTREGVLGGVGRALGGHGDRCVRNWLIVTCIDEGHAH